MKTWWLSSNNYGLLVERERMNENNLYLLQAPELGPVLLGDSILIYRPPTDLTHGLTGGLQDQLESLM